MNNTMIGIAATLVIVVKAVFLENEPNTYPIINTIKIIPETGIVISYLVYDTKLPGTGYDYWEESIRWINGSASTPLETISPGKHFINIAFEVLAEGQFNFIDTNQVTFDRRYFIS